jgi:uncharacterized protein YraI
MWKQALAGFGASLAFATVAAADIPATAITDLNIRSGPGPEFPVTGLIRANTSVAVTGCVQGSQWCTVNNGVTIGWAYSAYLTTAYSGNQVALAQPPAGLAVPPAVYNGPVPPTSIPGPAVAPAAPVGAIIAAPIGPQASASVPVQVAPAPLQAPPLAVQSYVTANPVPQVILNGEVVVGAALPPTVAVNPVPAYQYDYVYVNGQPVLVDPVTRQIVYIFR